MALGVEGAERVEAMLGDEYQPPPDTRESFLTIESVEREADGWGIDTTDHTHFFIKKSDLNDEYRYGEKRDFEPKAGDEVHLYVVRGSSVIGVGINGETLYLKSEREVNLDWLSYRAHLARKNIERYEKQKDELNAKLEDLPEPLRRRLKRILKENPEFRYESMGFSYELFCMEEAARFAKIAEQTVAAVGALPSEAESFWDDEAARREAYGNSRDYDEFKESIYGKQPESDEAAWLIWVWGVEHERQAKILEPNKDHSGNTFGAAMRFAIYLLESPELIQ